MTSWSSGHLVNAESIAHTARVAAAVAQHADERRNRAMVAAGLLRGHFGPGGSLCVGHLASEHTDAADQLDGHAAEVERGHLDHAHAGRSTTTSRAIVGGRGSIAGGVAGTVADPADG